MRLLLTAMTFLLLTAAAGPDAAAQEFVATPVEISADKVNVRGTIYYLHKVLKGHTLYSISKAYGISIDDIRKANPDLSDGLKAGMLLYIPEQAAPAAPAVSAQDTAAGPAPAGPEKVQKPDRQKPAAGKKAGKDASKRYRKYNVKWYETLDDVAVKFNVTTEAIIALNGIDPGSGKRIKSILIPDKEYMRSFRAADSTAEEEEQDTPVQEPEPEAEAERTEDREERNVLPVTAVTGRVLDMEPVDDDSPRTITLVLPFNASRLTDDLNAYTADFYAGTMIALADLKERGFSNFHLNVVDLNRYGSAWELVSSNALRGSDLIIGPISERDIQPVASWARREKIPVVSPLDLKTASLTQGNPMFFLFPPQSDLALSHQIDKIEKNEAMSDTTGSVTVIYEQGHDRSELVSRTLNGLNNKGIRYRTFKYDFLSGRGIDTLMSLSLDSALVNRVIIPSMSEAFITDALRNLSLIESSRGYSIEVYGMSQWKSFETIELDYFHALDLRLAMSYNIDYTDSTTTEFIQKYRAAFNAEPTSFAYQGYDILTFFADAMRTWGDRFPEAIIYRKKSMLQSDVLFLPAGPGSGYINCAFKDIRFTDGWRIIHE